MCIYIHTLPAELGQNSSFFSGVAAGGGQPLNFSIKPSSCWGQPPTFGKPGTAARVVTLKTLKKTPKLKTPSRKQSQIQGSLTSPLIEEGQSQVALLLPLFDSRAGRACPLQFWCFQAEFAARNQFARSDCPAFADPDRPRTPQKRPQTGKASN